MTEKRAKVRTFYDVHVVQEKSPRARFLTYKEAEHYGYIRFGTGGAYIMSSTLPSKTGFSSIQFKEGIAFNRIMALRREGLFPNKSEAK